MSRKKKCSPGGHVLYFAYGSNLNPLRMRRRCPDAIFLGTATLRGWRIVERLYADVERLAGGSVQGVVYRLGMRDWNALCGFEGEPFVYRYGAVSVWMDGIGWKQCLTFAMTKRTRAERNGKPYPEWYRSLCSVGATAHGIRDDFAETKVG